MKECKTKHRWSAVDQKKTHLICIDCKAHTLDGVYWSAQAWFDYYENWDGKIND